MIKDEDTKFDCTGCGACCRRVGDALEQLNEYDFPYKTKEDGSCEMLDENNKCKVYNNRPEVCSVEAMFKKLHSDTLKTRKEIFLQEAEICNSFIEEDGLDEKYYIDLKQYT